MSVGAVNKNTGDRIPTAGNPLDKVGNLASLHTTAKNDAVSAINEVKDEQANKADKDIVADAFSAAETYAEGDYCTYEGGLYKFKTAHEGAWDAADVDQIKIAGELSELKNTITNMGNMRMTKLWENPNPSAKFDEQTITLSSADYDLLLIMFTASTGTTRKCSEITLRGFGATLSVAEFTSNSASNRVRYFVYSSTTVYNVGGGSVNGVSDNTVIIPYRVYGIKLI